MAIDTELEEATPSIASKRQRAKRRRELLYRFVDQFANAPVEITPRWQKAIDTYKRNKGMEQGEAKDAGQSDE